MKKFLLVFYILLNILNADMLSDKIENIIGKEQSEIHNNLLNLLFKDKNSFYITSKRLNYIKLLKILKDNGLLNLKLQKPKEIKVEFVTNTDAIKSLKIINETLRAMGYYYYFTSSANYNSKTQQLSWVIVFQAEYILDPLFLIQELKNKACTIINIQRKNNIYWKYTLNVENANIKEALKIDNNEKLILQKPLRPYFLEVNDASKLQIIGRNLNHWFPYIAFYDKHLNVLKVIKKKRIYKGYRTNIPKNTKYIKITDLYTLINIKRGLSIIVR